jgi:hypothetical protein
MNPNLRPGQPIRMVSGALDAWQAQHIADLTGRPVFASPWPVGFDAGRGPLPVRQFVLWDAALERLGENAARARCLAGVLAQEVEGRGYSVRCRTYRHTSCSARR